MSPAAGPTSLELYLVRHAVAAERGPDYPNDAERPLTEDGVERFRRAVAGLRDLGVQLDLVLSSPYVRARETAELLCVGVKPRPKLVVVEALACGGKPADVIAAAVKHAAAGRGASRVALVGHEPDLGELAARLLGAKGRVEFKKGAVCRIDVDRAMPAGPGTLRWLLTPRVLRGLAP
jgi:phosphohistidine phosphatase